MSGVSYLFRLLHGGRRSNRELGQLYGAISRSRRFYGPAMLATFEAVSRGERVCIARPDGMYFVQKQGRRLLVERRAHAGVADGTGCL